MIVRFLSLGHLPWSSSISVSFLFFWYTRPLMKYIPFVFHHSWLGVHKSILMNGPLIKKNLTIFLLMQIHSFSLHKTNMCIPQINLMHRMMLPQRIHKVKFLIGDNRHCNNWTLYWCRKNSQLRHLGRMPATKWLHAICFYFWLQSSPLHLTSFFFCFWARELHFNHCQICGSHYALGILPYLEITVR